MQTGDEGQQGGQGEEDGGSDSAAKEKMGYKPSLLSLIPSLHLDAPVSLVPRLLRIGTCHLNLRLVLALCLLPGQAPGARHDAQIADC
jgi:hypothetical protein